jgi:hypothetical protein
MTKQELREQIQREMEQFLALGGKIEVVPARKAPRVKAQLGSVYQTGRKQVTMMRKGYRKSRMA